MKRRDEGSNSINMYLVHVTRSTVGINFVPRYGRFTYVASQFRCTTCRCNRYIAYMYCTCTYMYI